MEIEPMKQLPKIQDKEHQLRSVVDGKVKCREKDSMPNDKPHVCSVEYKNQYGFITARSSADPKQYS